MTQWTDYVKRYAKDNNLTYREGLKQAGQHYKSKPKQKPKYKRIDLNIIHSDNILKNPQQQMPSVVMTHPNKKEDIIQIPEVKTIIKQNEISNVSTINPVQELKSHYNNQQNVFKSMMDQINYNYKIKSRELTMSKLNLNRGVMKNKINELKHAYELQKKELIASQSVVNKTLLNKINSMVTPVYIRV